MASQAMSSSSSGGAGGISVELEHAIGFNAQISSGLWLHPDGQHYVQSAGGCLVINHIRDPHQQTFLRGHKSAVSCLALSSSGAMAASAENGDEADVIVCDVKTSKPLYRFAEHNHGVNALCFSQDERFLVTVGDIEDKTLYLWDLKTGNIVCRTRAGGDVVAVQFGGRVRDIKGRPTTHLLIITAHGKSQRVALWDIDPATGTIQSKTCRAPHFTRNYSCVGIDEDDKYVYAGTQTSDVAIYNAIRGSLVGSFPANSAVHSLRAIGRRGNKLGIKSSAVLVGCRDGTVGLFEKVDEKFVDMGGVQLDGMVTSVSVSPDETRVMVGTAQGNVYRLRVGRDSSTGLFSLEPTLLNQSCRAAMSAVAYRHGVSDRFLTTSDDSTLRLWDASTYRVLSSATPSKQARCAVVSRDCLIVGCTDGFIRAYSPSNGELLWQVHAHKHDVTAIALAKNEKFTVSGDSRGSVRVWYLKSRQLVADFHEHVKEITKLVIYDNNMHVLSASRDGSFICWDLQSEKRISSHRQPSGGLNAIDLIADQTRVLSSGQERSITEWSLDKAAPIRTLPLNRKGSKDTVGEVLCLSAAHTLPVFATGGADQSVRIWDYKLGKCVFHGVGHSAAVVDIKFSADDKQVVSVGADGCIFVWNIYAL